MDIPPTLPTQKPATVSRAIKLLYSTLAIGFLRSALEWSFYIQIASIAFVVSVSLLTLAIFVWLISKIDKGRNWARITFLVLFLLGVPMSIQPLLQSFAHAPLSGVLGLSQAVIQAVCIFMLFGRSARPWFRSTAMPTQISTPA